MDALCAEQNLPERINALKEQMCLEDDVGPPDHAAQGPTDGRSVVLLNTSSMPPLTMPADSGSPSGAEMLIASERVQAKRQKLEDLRKLVGTLQAAARKPIDERGSGD